MPLLPRRLWQRGHTHAHLLHERPELILQGLGQMWASTAWSCAQEAKAVDSAELSLHLPACLEQPGCQDRKVSQQEGPWESGSCQCRSPLL